MFRTFFLDPSLASQCPISKRIKYVHVLHDVDMFCYVRYCDADEGYRKKVRHVHY